MPYQDSYIAKIRQFIGHDFELIMPTIDIIAENEAGKFLVVFNRDFNGWTFPGGYIEPDATWIVNATRELKEEGGIITDPDNLILIGTISGNKYRTKYPNGDLVKQYSNVYLVKKWQSEINEVDTTEIDGKKWVTKDELKNIDLTNSAKADWKIYLKYQKEQRPFNLAVD